jgi:hypothetical protein
MNQITPETMQRLAFIRLLTQQGLEQSRQPDPLAAASILTFHDAVELFLMLAAEHLGITVPDKGQFVQRYFDTIHPDKAGAGGIDLAGRVGVDRLTRHRNAFKHTAAMPSGPSIEQARADTTRFLEDNTPRVFGVAFDGIDMADLIPQPHTRVKVKEAQTSETAGDRVQAMAGLAEAFDELLSSTTGPRGWRATALSFGPDLSYPMGRSDILKTLRQPSDQDGRMPARGAARLADELVALRESVKALQRGARVTALGLDYSEYLRFVALTPNVYRRSAHAPLDVKTPDGYDPDAQELAFCQRFVIAAALRISDALKHRQPPSWQE